jgi:uncharacterized phiE125 gp8 family phage protein
MRSVVTARPATLAVDLGLVKQHLRIDHADEDALLSIYMRSGTEALEKYGIGFLTHTRVQKFHQWSPVYQLDTRPVSAIVAFRVFGTDDQATTWPAANYLFGRDGLVIQRHSAIRPDVELREYEGIQIEYQCGFGSNPSDIPADLQIPLLLLAGHYNEHREEVIVGSLAIEPKLIEWGVDRHITAYRSW